MVAERGKKRTERRALARGSEEDGQAENWRYREEETRLWREEERCIIKFVKKRTNGQTERSR